MQVQEQAAMQDGHFAKIKELNSEKVHLESQVLQLRREVSIARPSWAESPPWRLVWGKVLCPTRTPTVGGSQWAPIQTRRVGEGVLTPTSAAVRVLVCGVVRTLMTKAACTHSLRPLALPNVENVSLACIRV